MSQENAKWTPPLGTTYILPDGTRETGKSPAELREAQRKFWEAWRKESLYRPRAGFTPLTPEKLETMLFSPAKKK
jgi:hypothetical protein